MKFFRSRKRIFLLTLVGVCLLLIILSNVIDAGPTIFSRAYIAATAPVHGFFNGVGNWFGDRWDGLRGTAALAEDNRRLRTENALLVMENSRLRYFESVLADYAMLLNTQIRYSEYPTIVGHVRSVDPGNWFNRFIIDVGTAHGVEENMPVLADGALVGRISRVWGRWSRVESIIDDRSGVSAMVFRSNDVGVIRGDVVLMLDGLVRMEFTQLGVDIVEGDVIYTSELSSLYPPGILIGHVESVQVDSRGMTSAIVRPAADFSSVRFVLVITELFTLDYED